MSRRWHYRASSVRLRIWGDLLREAQNGDCPLCARPLPKRGVSIDHVIPLSKGGADTIGNWMLVHTECNSRKGAAMPTDLQLRKLARVNERLAVPA